MAAINKKHLVPEAVSVYFFDLQPTTSKDPIHHQNFKVSQELGQASLNMGSSQDSFTTIKRLFLNLEDA